MRSHTQDSAPTAVVEAIVQSIETLSLGVPMVAGALAVVPVYRRAESPRLEYQTLAEALTLGSAVVTEAPQATIPMLRVHNFGSQPVFILDGEEVVGGQQNRVVNTSLLIGPTSIFDLPVSCVEAVRWTPTNPVFGAGETAYPTLRKQKLQQVSASFARVGRPVSDQKEVWKEIADRQQRSGVRSTTGAVRDMFLSRQAELDEADRVLSYPDGGLVGVIALVGGRSQCADVFDRPETLRAYWPRLIRSYALEALESAPRPSSLDSARRLLSRARVARRSAYRSPGLGTDVRLSGRGIVGAALVASGVAVHSSVFRQRDARTAAPIGTPSRRARWLRG